MGVKNYNAAATAHPAQSLLAPGPGAPLKFFRDYLLFCGMMPSHFRNSVKRHHTNMMAAMVPIGPKRIEASITNPLYIK